VLLGGTQAAAAAARAKIPVLDDRRSVPVKARLARQAEPRPRRGPERQGAERMELGPPCPHWQAATGSLTL